MDASKFDLTTEHCGNGFVVGRCWILATDSSTSFMEYIFHPINVTLLLNQLSSHIQGETAVSGGSSNH